MYLNESEHNFQEADKNFIALDSVQTTDVKSHLIFDNWISLKY